jgi:hypothetical protein
LYEETEYSYSFKIYEIKIDNNIHLSMLYLIKISKLISFILPHFS